MIDYIYMITSYERYDKVLNMVNNILEFESQPLIILIDDNSKDNRYLNFKNYNPRLIYLRNNVNNGKERFWLTIDRLYKKISNYNFKFGIMLQDDFEMIPNFESFLKKIVDNNNLVRLFTPTTIENKNWGYENWIDGTYCAPHKFFKSLNFEVYPIHKNFNKYTSSGVGAQLTERLNKLNFTVKNYGSMLEHIGNEDSKMHPEFRKNNPLVSNINFNKPLLSVIIPTYDNVNYIDECLNSLIQSAKINDIEILIGIDGCRDTLNHIEKNNYPNNVIFYYFEKNEGPYSIKNTLSNLSKSDKLLFFDSDDVSNENFIPFIIENLEKYDCIKPKYEEFGKTKNKNKIFFGEGVFGIHKNIFMKLNGFEPWMCAADSDFMARLYKTKIKLHHTNEIMFKRRVHENSLTQKKDTGLTSIMRHEYSKLSKSKKGNLNPLILNVRDFIKIKGNHKIYETKTVIINNKKNNIETINKVLNKIPKTIEIEKVGPKKHTTVTNNPIFTMLNKNTEKKDLNKEMVTKQRNEVIQIKNKTRQEINNEVFKVKPNRRKDLPNLRIG